MINQELQKHMQKRLNEGKAYCQEPAPKSKEFYIPCGNQAVLLVGNEKKGEMYFACGVCGMKYENGGLDVKILGRRES